MPPSQLLVHNSLTVSREIELKQEKLLKLGDTPVRLQAGSQEHFALVACGDGFWRLTLAKDGDSIRHVLEKVWITDQNNVSVFS